MPKNFSCVTGDTLVTLPDRIAKIKDLCEENYNSFVLSNDSKFRKCSGVVERGEKPVYKLTLKNGLTIKATDDHKFETTNGLKQLSDLIIGEDKVKVNTGYNFSKYDEHDTFYEMLGWMHGDGWMTENGIGISFNNKDGDYQAKDRLLPEFKKFFECDHIKPLKDDDVSYQLQLSVTISNRAKCSDLGITLCHANERRLPGDFYKWTLSQQYSFIRGLFASDGNVQGKCNGQIWLYSASERLVSDVQTFLASVGIHSSLYCSKFIKQANRKPQYKLGISKDSARIFMDVIGFNGHKKKDRFNLTNYKDETAYIIKSIDYAGIEMTYDVIEVSGTNMFYANGMSVHNCNLGSLNLSEFVKNPYTDEAFFDWEEFEKSVRIGIEALDTIIDENLHRHALKEQSKNSSNYRNVGLGVMGYANMLFKLGLTYGKVEALAFTDKLFKFMFITALKTSCDLAKERGKFPKCKNNLVAQSTIVQRYASPELIEEIKEYGLRNCSLLSIAPTGSISTMLGITGGCEPEFALSYKRKTDNLGESYDMFCRSVNEYFDTVGVPMEERNIGKLPDCFITSKEIHWRDRINTQAIMQDYIDTAISSTINLPKETTAAEIEEAYLYAWKKGVKGITIFRDGCKRAGILTTEEQKSETKEVVKTEEKSGLKRGDIICVSDDLLSMKRTIVNGCGNFYIHVDFDEFTGEPLETYIDIGSGGGCERNLQFISRLISLCLRAGVPLDEIIEQSRSIKACSAYTTRTLRCGDTSKGNSCPGAIGFALKELQEKINARCFIEEDEIEEEVSEYEETIVKVQDEEEQDEKPRCPECGEELMFAEGCVKCTSCFYSRC